MCATQFRFLSNEFLPFFSKKCSRNSDERVRRRNSNLFLPIKKKKKQAGVVERETAHFTLSFD